MNILAIDTATDVLSVGLETEGGFFETCVVAGLRHSEYLLPSVAQLLDLAGVNRTFDLVICMRGPGSFTGLRIGMASAKGLAAASGCPLVAVPTLDVLADGFEFFPGIVVPVIDARKRRVYSALYRRGQKTSDDLDIAPGDLAEKLPADAPVLVTGPGSPLMAERVAAHPQWGLDPRRTTSRASSLLHLGRLRFEQHGPDPVDLGPVYLRKSEAEVGRANQRGGG